MMTAAKIVHHQLKSSVGLFDSRVRGAGGAWPHSGRSRGSSMASVEVSIEAIVGEHRIAQPAKGEHKLVAVRNAQCPSRYRCGGWFRNEGGCRASDRAVASAACIIGDARSGSALD